MNDASRPTAPCKIEDEATSFTALVVDDVDQARYREKSPCSSMLAIFIQPMGGSNTHTGILYRTKKDANTTYILDLRWHHILRSEVATETYCHVVIELTNRDLFSVLMMCRRIHNKNKKGKIRIPYAFLHDSARFTNDGDIALGNDLGLTCSTFVLTVFESAGVQLATVSSWEHRPEDKQKHHDLVAMLKKGIRKFDIPPADPAHVERVNREVDCVRVRPEEVAAAGLFRTRPVTYVHAEPAGRWILSKIRSAQPRNKESSRPTSESATEQSAPEP